MPVPKLVILRGPSGSGKTTVGKILFEGAQRPTALIEQDHYRFMFNPPGGGTKPNSDTIHHMIKHNTLQALADGYNVILEGILSVRSYGEVLEEIFRQHPSENYIFYFDISFEETLRRHQTRQVKLSQFGEADMREWYPAAHQSNHQFEYVISEQSSVEETVALIKKTAAL